MKPASASGDERVQSLVMAIAEARRHAKGDRGVKAVGGLPTGGGPKRRKAPKAPKRLEAHLGARRGNGGKLTGGLPNVQR